MPKIENPKFTYTEQEPSYTVTIHIAGNYDRIEQVCSDFCSEVGLCVNVKPTNFIYTYGEQSGAEIQLISYPKFQPTLGLSRRKAQMLCERLMDEVNQKSATITDPKRSLYIERKEL